MKIIWLRISITALLVYLAAAIIGSLVFTSGPDARWAAGPIAGLLYFVPLVAVTFIVQAGLYFLLRAFKRPVLWRDEIVYQIPALVLFFFAIIKDPIKGDARQVAFRRFAPATELSSVVVLGYGYNRVFGGERMDAFVVGIAPEKVGSLLSVYGYTKPEGGITVEDCNRINRNIMQFTRVYPELTPGCPVFLLGTNKIIGQLIYNSNSEKACLIFNYPPRNRPR
jgi:hypothetical protein